MNIKKEKLGAALAPEEQTPDPSTESNLVINFGEAIAIKGAQAVRNEIDNSGILNLLDGASMIVSSVINQSSGTIRLIGSNLTTTTITNDGIFSMDLASTLTFTTIDGTGTFEFVVTDHVHDEPHLLLDSVNNDYTVEQYQALLGDVWGDYTFAVQNGDLYLVDDSVVIHVDKDYSADSDNDGFIWGKTAFDNLTDAKAANPGRLVIHDLDYSASELSHIGFDGIETYIRGGNYGSTVVGGSVIELGRREWADLVGDTNLTIRGGTFNHLVTGGDRVSGGSVERVGDTNLTISGGTFNAFVAGGSAFWSADRIDQHYQVGDVNLTISGGTFNYHIYGGSISQSADNTVIEGNVNLKIDVSNTNTVTVASGYNILGGSYENGEITGNVTATLTGNGANFQFDGILSGANGSAYYMMENGERVLHSTVEGERIIAFDAYTGDFDGQIRAFTTARITNGSAVNFTHEELDLSEIATWEFDAGSSLSGLGANDFSGDQLKVDLSSWAAEVDSYTLMSGDASIFSTFDQLAGVQFDGVAAVWDGVKWSSSDYQLTLEDGDTDKQLVVAKLA